MGRFVEAYEGYEREKLTEEEAARLLGVTERHFRRMRVRYEQEGLEGLVDRRLGKASARRVPVDKIEWVIEEYKTRYVGFTAKHFHEKMKKNPTFTWGYTWTKTLLQSRGLLEKAPRKGVHRKKRPRRPLEGMMLHQDASKHDWLGDGSTLDLVVTMDDATSEIYSAFLTDEEGTVSSFQGLADVIETKGLPCSFYTDRGSHYWITPEAGGKVDKVNLTQFGRAIKQLGIEGIAAYSPEARGRSERMFRTLQDRLVNELALAKIGSKTEANRFIREVYLPEHNKLFSVDAEQKGSAFVPVAGEAWRDILCIQEERQVGNDNTVRYNGLCLQLPAVPERPHFVKATVRVHDYPDGALAIFHGPRCLAKYTDKGDFVALNPRKTSETKEKKAA